MYHEAQSEAMCAAHALNGIVQAPMFSEVDLAQAGIALSEREAALRAEGGVESEEYLAYVGGENAYVGDDGNFSVEVLNVALGAFGLVAVNGEHPSVVADIAANPGEAGEAYILNSGSHWLALRKIGGVWYNLDSLADNPQIVSEFYLSAYLATMRQVRL